MNKILHVGQGGGIDRVIKELALGLKIFDSEIVSFGLSDGKNSSKDKNIPYPKIEWKGKFNIFGYLKGMHELTNFLKRRHPDIVMLHGFISFVFGAFPAFLARVPLIIAVDHGPQFTYTLIKKLPLLFANNFIDHFICVSPSSRQWLLHNFSFVSSKKTTVIENCISMDQFCKIRGRRLKSPPYIITMVSRLEAPPKDPHTLLYAIKLLHQKKYPIYLRFVGDGNARLSIEKLTTTLNLTSYVEITGFTSQVPKFLKDTDVFVLSTRGEGMPMCIIEAMAAGLPIVSSKVIGVIDVIKQGETGLLVAPENPEALAQAIQKLIDNSKYALELGDKARREASYRFTQKRMIEQYESLLQCLLRKKLCVKRV